MFSHAEFAVLSLLFLVPIALLLTLLAVGFFYWAVKDGQYDDLDRAGKDLLFDDEQHKGGQDEDAVD